MNIKQYPEEGDHVKVVFRNCMVEEGIVLIWTSDIAVLKSPVSDSQLIIQNTKEDVIAIKICVEPNHELLDVAQVEGVEPDKYYRHEDLRAKKLAELHQMKAKEERIRARELLTSKRPSGLQGHAYDVGRSTVPKIQPIPKYPREKA